MTFNDSHQHVVKTTAQWGERAVEYWVVPRGCLCIELTPEGKTKLKVGEGSKYFSQLPYICDHGDLSNYYTKEEIDDLFNNLNRMAIVSTDVYDSKDDLPLTDNKLGDVRFVKSDDEDPTIFIWNGTKWISTKSDADLSDYVTKPEFNVVKDKVDEIYPKAHTHANKNILDGITQADRDKFDSLHNYDDTEIRELIEETGHTHPNKALLDTITQSSLWSSSDRDKFNDLHNYDDTQVKFRLVTVEEKAHTHANKTVLDGITQEKLDEINYLATTYTIVRNDIRELQRKSHVHDNLNVLEATTAAYTIEQENELRRLSGIGVFLGAGPTWNGVFGYVPAPLSGQENYFLRGDGTWAETNLPIASETTLGGIKVGNNLTIDPVTGVLDATGGGSEYIAGDGININQASTYGHPQYYFDTQVQCRLDQTAGSMLTRIYTKVNTIPALGAIMALVSPSDNITYYGPLFVSTDPDGVLISNNYNSDVSTYIDTVQYRGQTWYISSSPCWISDASNGDQLGNVPNLSQTTYSGTDMYIDAAKALIDAADPYTTNEISAKIGNGLQFDANGAIEAKLGDGLSFDSNDAITVDEMTGATALVDGTSGTVPAPLAGDEEKYLRGDGTWSTVSGGASYVEGDGIELIGTVEVDMNFDYTAFVNSLTGVYNGTLTKNVDGSITITPSSASGSWTVPDIGGGSPLPYTFNVGSGTTYKLTWDSGDDTVNGTARVFENAALTTMYIAPQSAHELTFTTSNSCSYISIRFEETDLLPMTISNVKLYRLDASAVSINAKLGDGLQFDANGAIEVISSTQYVRVNTTDSYVLLHTKPADWDDHWDKYFELTYDEITTAPPDWDPTQHYKYENDNYVLGSVGDTFVSTTWYDKHYVGLDPTTAITFDSDVYYTGELHLIEDGETYDTAFEKVNEAIEHIERLEQEVQYLQDDKVGVRVTNPSSENLEFYNK